MLICFISFLLGCVADSSKKDEVKTSPDVVNRLIGNNISPADFPSRSQSIITLDYTSIDNELASACAISSLDNVTVTQACSCDGVGVCVVGIKGVGVYSGGAGFSFNVQAGGKTSTTGRAAFNITPPPAGSNEVPTISSIPAQSTIENTAVNSIAFSVSDNDSTVTCSNVTASSSNTTVLPNGNIVISGSVGSCFVSVTPGTNQTGSSNITLTLTDTGTPLPAQTATATFTLTVAVFNDPPTITSISSQVTNEDVATSAIAFTIADVDSTVNCSNVTATSSNMALVSNVNVVVGGAGTSCNVTVTPNLNQFGTTNITVTVTDNGSPMPAKTASRSFALVVASVNDAPVLNAISGQSTTQNIAKAVDFTITDVDSNLACASSVSINSSNTTVLPNTNISITGIAPNCTATLTPASNQSGLTTVTVTVADNGFPLPIQTASANFVLNVARINQAPLISAISTQTINEDTNTNSINFTISDSDSTVYCNNVVGTSSNTTAVPNANIFISGTAPNCTVLITPISNSYGSSTITLTLTDNGTPSPSLQATSIFILTINAVNDAPTISPITNKTTNQSTPSSSIAFTISDVDSTLSCTTSITMNSSNATLIPNGNVVFAGTAPNCTAVVTPAGANFGTSNLTFTVTDNGNPMPAQTAATAFTMTVNQVNQVPQISAISNTSVNEDTTTSAIAFTIVDVDSTVFCNNVTATSSNTTLVPNANIVIAGTAPNCTAVITPTANGNGSTTLTLTLTDNGSPLPSQTATSVFVLTVYAVNDAPSIAALTNKSTDEDTAVTAVAVTISDVDSTLNCIGNLSAVSSNTSLIPNANVTFSGTAPNCLMTITPSANNNGSANVTVTVTDNGTPTPALTASRVFSTTVVSVPDISGTLTNAANLGGVASSFAANTYAKNIKFTGISSDEALTSVEVCLGTSSGGCEISSWVEATGYTTSGTAPTVALGGTYRMKSGTGGAQVFTLTASCGTTTNYYYSIRATNASSKISNILTTPAWTFWQPSCLGSTVLALWLDASETSTITIATGVSNWTDKSGNGRTLTQATTAKQPALNANGIGTGLAGVVFDGLQAAGTGDTLTRASFIYGLGATSVFSVIKGTAINANRYIFGEGAGAGTNGAYSPFATSTTNTLTGLHTNNANTADLNLPASSSVLFNGTVKLGMIEDTGSSFYTYSNGTAQSQAVTNYTRSATTLTTMRLGSRFKTNAEVGWIAATVGEFIVTNGVLSTLNRQKLEGYSAHKWGVSANLPGGHPYLSVAP